MNCPDWTLNPALAGVSGHLPLAGGGGKRPQSNFQTNGRRETGKRKTKAFSKTNLKKAIFLLSRSQVRSKSGQRSKLQTSTILGHEPRHRRTNSSHSARTRQQVGKTKGNTWHAIIRSRSRSDQVTKGHHKLFVQWGMCGTWCMGHCIHRMQ